VRRLNGTLLLFGSGGFVPRGELGYLPRTRRTKEPGFILPRRSPVRGIEIGGREKDVVGLEVEAHGACAPLGGDISRTVYLSGESSCTTVRCLRRWKRRRAEWPARRRWLNTFTDCGSRNDFSSVRIHDRHDFFIANSKQAAVLPIHGQS